MSTTAFDQKPRFATRPLEWLFTGGKSSRRTGERFLRELSDWLHVIELPGQTDVCQPRRLLPLRKELQQLAIHQECIPALQIHLHDQNPLIRAIAVWALSEHANRFFLLGIDKLIHDSSQLVRKHVARALRRLEAWEELDEMAADYPEDDSVVWFANAVPNSKSYNHRLGNFTAHVASKSPTSESLISRMPLWFRDEYWEGSLPKSVEFIRRILVRIRLLVHGKAD